MAEKEEEVLKTLLPMVGVGTAVIVVFALSVRTFAMSHQAHYQDGQYLVSVRYGQWHDVKEFVQPDNPNVVAVYSQIGPDPWALYDFVCRHVAYKREVGEMWQFPSETLARGKGDCEDTSFLLCSLLRNTINAYVALGSFQGYGHAWCQLDGQILETTYTSARPVSDSQDYCPYVCFNDQEVVELWPGALGEVFNLRRNEAIKLNLMARAAPVDAVANPGSRYAGLPQACICESCGYELPNPGTHCRATACPICGGIMWRKK